MSNDRADIESRFPEHVATHRVLDQDGESVERLTWRKPGTNFYRIDYTCYPGSLVVTGDCYDAIYMAGGRGLEFWAACDLSYFAGKCVASPYGRGYKQWDQVHAEKRVRELLKDRANDRRRGWLSKEEFKSVRDCVKDYRSPLEAVYSEWDWNCWLRDHGDDVLGGDCWECGSIGMTVSWECAAHLYGLKMALAQLAAVSA